MRLLAACLVVLPALASAAPAAWDMDPEHSNVTFSVKHLGLTNVKGEMNKMKGRAEVDPDDVTKSVLEATIEAASIDTNNQKRDEHLRSADFLDVKKFPTITFKSKRWEKAGEGRYKVVGDLTLRGVTKETALDVEWSGKELKSPSGKMLTAATATTVINRKDFGASWNNLIEGVSVVGDDVKITIETELVKKAEAKQAAAGKK